MAVLGAGGRLELKRDAPESCFITEDALNWNKDVLTSICDGYLSGDHITAIGLPIMGDLFPTKPEGYATYEGSKWYLGPNRLQIDADEDVFYKEDGEDYPIDQFGDDAQFYARTGDEACIFPEIPDGEIPDGPPIAECDPLPGLDNDDYWIHIDSLGYVSFYKNRCDALLGCSSQRVDLINVGGPIVIAPYGSGDYQNALTVCYDQLGSYLPSDITDSVTLGSVCDDAPLYELPEPGIDEYDNADVTPRGQVSPDALWQIVCELREWSLELDAPSVDVQGVGEKFGNSIKSIVTGGGSMEYFIDRKCLDDRQTDALQIMQLLLMTENGCQVSARFWVMDRGDQPCDYRCGPLPGQIYYETDLLITRNAVNLRPSDLVAGTANFITTGEVKLLIGPD